MEHFSEMRLQRSSRRKLEGFFRESKVSSEERWVWTHISFWNAVQLHLRIFRGCVYVFRSCVCVFQAALITEKQNSNKRFPQTCVIFKDAYRSWGIHLWQKISYWGMVYIVLQGVGWPFWNLATIFWNPRVTESLPFIVTNFITRLKYHMYILYNALRSMHFCRRNYLTTNEQR